MVNLIKGGVAKDARGQIRFVNDFDMSQVKRFYLIKNEDTELIRGWRGHKIEQRWFYVLSGAFEISIVKIDNWDNATSILTIEHNRFAADDMQVLHVPAGYATAFKALSTESEVLVFADYPIDHAKNDDYTWPIDYFVNEKS